MFALLLDHNFAQVLKSEISCYPLSSSQTAPHSFAGCQLGGRLGTVRGKYHCVRDGDGAEACVCYGHLCNAAAVARKSTTAVVGVLGVVFRLAFPLN